MSTFVNRKERDSREDAGASVPDQQMRLPTPRYPVDRYLVESSKTMDMDKLIDDLWKPEPTLSLEDEIMLRELHGMLQSTADDLRVLSAELSKYHEPRVQVKTMPTPLDEDYNEQMHIEEIVDAKLHGIEPSSSKSTLTPQNISKIVDEIVADKLQNVKPVIESVKHKPEKRLKSKPLKKLTISRTNILQIAENKTQHNNNLHNVKISQAPKNNMEERTVYKEIIHEYAKPNTESIVRNTFNIQKMPSINIRSELRTQNVLQLDIIPDDKALLSNTENKSNVAVISVLHELPSTSQNEMHEKQFKVEQPPVRKVFKMESYVSSESSNNNVTNDNQIDYKQKPTRKALDRRKDVKIKFSNTDIPKKDARKPRSNLNDWKKKLNTIYGQSTRKLKSCSKKTNANSNSQTLQVPVNQPEKNNLNNTQYIPYAKLTLGGVRVKDIERELSQVSKNHDVPLSPILDKILSRQNSFSHDKSHKSKDDKILTTSDENLLQEVLDIEEKVISTLSKNKNSNNTFSLKDLSNNEDDNTYADDFEIDNSEALSAKSLSAPVTSNSPEGVININTNDKTTSEPCELNENINTTYVKVSNLSFKNHIDTFEFIHTIDKQDIATQSNAINKISLKETQTSPRNENDTIQTIRNDLSIDPRHEIENMFKIEKDFIKKLIIDEYSDIIEKKVNKPSTSYDSKTNSDEKNISKIQKNTQTSPARVKNVMTSPTPTKNRTTSPFALSVTVHKKTSPMVRVSTDHDSGDEIQPIESRVTIDQEDHNITINLSSPRFSLRLPQSSCDLSHSGRHSRNKKILKPKPKIQNSSSSCKEDYSSSDISFGEIDRAFKRTLRRHKIPSISEPSSSSLSKYSDHSSTVAPLRSEGEISACQTRSNKYSKSEGEISLGQVKRH